MASYGTTTPFLSDKETETDFLEYMLYMESRNTGSDGRGTVLERPRLYKTGQQGYIPSAPRVTPHSRVTWKTPGEKAEGEGQQGTAGAAGGEAGVQESRAPPSPSGSSLPYSLGERSYWGGGWGSSWGAPGTGAPSAMSPWGPSYIGSWGASGFGHTTHQHQHSSVWSHFGKNQYNRHFAFFPCHECNLTYVYRNKTSRDMVPTHMDDLLPMLVKARCSGIRCIGSDHGCVTPCTSPSAARVGRLQLPLYATRKVPGQGLHGHSPASGISPGYPSRGRPHPNIPRESYPRHPQYAKLTLPQMYKSNVYRSNGYKAMMDLAVMIKTLFFSNIFKVEFKGFPRLPRYLLKAMI